MIVPSQTIALASDRMLSVRDRIHEVREILQTCAERPDSTHHARLASLVLQDLLMTLLSELENIASEVLHPSIIEGECR